MRIARGDIILSIPTTDKTKLWEAINTIKEIDYCLGYGVESWEYKSGEMLYWLLLEFNVKTNLEQPTVERFLLRKLKSWEFKNELRNNKGEPVRTVDFMSYRHTSKVIELKKRKKRGLLSIDITKVKRLSLKEIKLPTTELRNIEPTPPIKVERPPSDERIAYSKLVAINPLLEELVERLDLVSKTTGERIKKVELKDNIKPHPEPKSKPKEIDKPKLITLAQRIIEGNNSYLKEELIERIKEATNVSQERADRGFNLILQAGAIEPTLGDRYYLTGSTPF